MENLWKINGQTASNANYVDLFAIAREKFGQCFNEWDEYITLNLNQWQHNKTIDKCNKTAKNLLDDGHEYFKKRNYRAAMEKYNNSLCFAEIGSKWQSLAFGYRSACFMRMKMYKLAMDDMRSALEYKHTGRTLLRLLVQLAECHQQSKADDLIEDVSVPESSYPLDKEFPCLADVLEIREDKVFGRHIVAKCDIEVGRIVIVPDIFATAAVSDTLTTCRICTKTQRNFIACPDCSNTMFCRDTCADRIGIHRLECGSLFSKIDTGLQLPIQTLLMAIDMFPSIDQLMEFVQRYVGGDNGYGVPKAAYDAKSKYAVFLTLVRSNFSEYVYLAYQVFTTLLTFPRVHSLMDTEKKRLFLAHLTLHHVTVIARNSFEYKSQDDIGTIKTEYIYDVLSLINHSCSPNLFNLSRPDKVSYCITIKPIWTGEQVFISYLGNSSTMSLEQRQSYLKHWSFRCNCDRCEFEKTYQPSPMKSTIEADTAYQYIINTCQEKECNEINGKCGKRESLKQSCIQCLSKFGHISWTPEIQFVVHCFTSH